MQDVATLEAVRLRDRDTRWMDDALCPLFPDVNFYPEQPGSPSNAERREYEDQVRKAQMVCEFCPVKAECLNDATNRNEHWGIWGGKDFYLPWRQLRNQKEMASAS
jgi:hypothetical protein